MNQKIHTIYLRILIFVIYILQAANVVAAGRADSDSLVSYSQKAVDMLDKADYTNALPVLNKLIREASRTGNRRAEYSARTMLGQLLIVTGKPEEGYKELTTALDGCVSLDEEQRNTNDIKIQAYNGMAIYFFTVKGDYYLGKEYFFKAIDLAMKAGDERLGKRFETNFIQAAIIERDTTFLNSAQDLYKWAVENGDPYTRYVSACQLAQLYSFTGKYSEAKAMLDDAVQTGKANNVGDWIPFYLSKADITEHNGDYAETEKILDHALASLGTGNEAAYFLSVIGSRKTGLFLTAKEYQKALDCGLTTLTNETQLNQKPNTGKLMLQISQAYEGLGDHGNALKYARMYENFKDSAYNREKELMLRSMATLHNVEKKEREAQYARQLLTQERQRNTFLIISIVLFAVAAVIAFIAYINKSRLHKKLVKLYQENINKEKESLKQLEKLQQSVTEPTEVVEISAETVESTDNETTTEEMAPDESNETFDRIWTNLLILLENTKDWSDSDTTRETISAKLHTNRTYLSKVVKDHTDMTFTQFINSRRINRAIEVLSDPANKDYPLKVLSQELGFKSLNAFYTNFKAITGLSPGSFRKNA
ncbi:MAG: AraC family transcriptional regulator [Bacteroides sp.]|nr:AraC family transcriptional regulator [Bacteroides sp.]